MANKLVLLSRPILVRAQPAAPTRTNCATCGQVLPLDVDAIAPGDYGAGQVFTVPAATLTEMLASGEAYDATPPVLSSVAHGTPLSDACDITWTSDRLANSQVYYRETAEPPNEWIAGTLADTAPMVTSHTVGVIGLNPSTGYDFKVRSQAAHGDATESAVLGFTTAAE